MVAKNKIRGYEIEYKGEYPIGEWVYCDTGESITNNERGCNFCGHDCADGVDGCLGCLPGVRNACCGDGDFRNSYIKFENNVTVRGFTVESNGYPYTPLDKEFWDNMESQ